MNVREFHSQATVDGGASLKTFAHVGVNSVPTSAFLSRVDPYDRPCNIRASPGMPFVLPHSCLISSSFHEVWNGPGSFGLAGGGGGIGCSGRCGWGFTGAGVEGFGGGVVGG
jgi:hypothetical protein